MSLSETERLQCVSVIKIKSGLFVAMNAESSLILLHNDSALKSAHLTVDATFSLKDDRFVSLPPKTDVDCLCQSCALGMGESLG